MRWTTVLIFVAILIQIGTASAALQIDETTCIAIGECVRCSSKEMELVRASLEDDSVCGVSGFKQMYQCKSVPCEDEDTECLQQFQKVVTKDMSCAAPDDSGSSLMRFESLMFLGAIGSLYIVWKQKNVAYQRLGGNVN